MTVEPGSIALISGGPAANLGKIVFVVGCPDDPRLPRVGGGGTVWDVQMIATPPLGLDGEEYLRIGIGEDWLMPIPVPRDLAAVMRECGLANVLHRAMEELLQEGFGDDGFVESAGTENRKLTEGGEMSGIEDGTRQLELALHYGEGAADGIASKPCSEAEVKSEVQQLTEQLERTAAEARRLMLAASRTPEEVRRLNLLDEEMLYVKGEIRKLEITEKDGHPEVRALEEDGVDEHGKGRSPGAQRSKPEAVQGTGGDGQAGLVRGRCNRFEWRGIMSNTNHPDFPSDLIEKREIEEVIGRLGFVAVQMGFERWVDGLKFTVCESFCCYFIVRDGRCDDRRWCEPHELRIFSPIAPIELMANIYRLWAEVFEKRESEDFCLTWGKSWLDYQGELKRLIPPPPTLWAEREFLRHCLNHIDRQYDWAEADYPVRLSSLPGQLRIVAKDTELFCPARGDWIGEVSISAKELFRNLSKRFIGPAVMLQIEADKLRIDNRVLKAKWGDPREDEGN